VQEHNSPLPKKITHKNSNFNSDLVLTVVVTCSLNGSLTACGRRGCRRQRQERENKFEQIDGGEDDGDWGWVYEADGGCGEIEKMRREDEDEREGSPEKSIMPLHFIGN